LDTRADTDARLLIAQAQAANSEVLGQVVDESVKRSAEAREKREAAEAQRREDEARDARRREEARREREAAEALAERYAWVARLAREDATRPPARRVAPEPRETLDLAA
jgi:hypothetical protein